MGADHPHWLVLAMGQMWWYRHLICCLNYSRAWCSGPHFTSGDIEACRWGTSSMFTQLVLGRAKIEPKTILFSLPLVGNLILKHAEDQSDPSSHQETITQNDPVICLF